VDRLRNRGIIYLATVYTKHPHGIEAAYVDACSIAGKLAKNKIPVFSPIAHTHHIAIYGGLDPLDHDIWIPFDTPMMAVSAALLVAKMENWWNSYGIGEEIKYFNTNEKPIFYLNPTTMEVHE
jgi:hypothetical protein